MLIFGPAAPLLLVAFFLITSNNFLGLWHVPMLAAHVILFCMCGVCAFKKALCLPRHGLGTREKQIEAPFKPSRHMSFESSLTAKLESF